MHTKKWIIIVSMTLLCMAPVKDAQAQIPIIDIIKAAVKKVIKQIDLQVQKLQNKTIALQNAQKTLENTLSKNKLKEISGWMEKQRKLYDEYYDELKKVKNAISTFQAVKDITQRQLQIVEEYKKAYTMFRADQNFSAQEISYIYKVYAGILSESAANLDRLFVVISSYRTQMTDGERLSLIAAIGKDMDENLSDLRKFTNLARTLSIQRIRARGQIEVSRKLYGIPLKD